jgi:hypothetical protein
MNRVYLLFLLSLGVLSSGYSYCVQSVKKTQSDAVVESIVFGAENEEAVRVTMAAFLTSVLDQVAGKIDSMPTALMKMFDLNNAQEAEILKKAFNNINIFKNVLKEFDKKLDDFESGVEHCEKKVEEKEPSKVFTGSEGAGARRSTISDYAAESFE